MSVLRKFIIVFNFFYIVKCANIDVDLKVSNYVDNKDLKCNNFKININDINSVEDFLKKIIEYKKDHFKEIQYFLNNEEIKTVEKEKDLDFIFANYTLESIWVMFSDLVKIDDLPGRSVSFYKNRYNDSFTILKPYLGKIENIQLTFCKKHKYKLECDFDELYDDLNGIIAKVNKGCPYIKEWNDELDSFLKKIDVKKQIITEINEFKQFFESEDSYHFTSNIRCSIYWPTFYDYDYFVEKGILKNKQICYFCYKFIFFKDIVKVVFDENLVKKYDYRVILLDTNGKQLNDDNTIYNTKKDIFENTLDGVYKKDSSYVSGKFEREVLKGKTKNDNNYYISNIYEIIEDKQYKILTIKIDDKRREFCNFTVINNSGKGLKKCTFLHRIHSVDDILSLMGIDNKDGWYLTKNNKIISDFGSTTNNSSCEIKYNFTGEYILKFFEKKNEKNEKNKKNKYESQDVEMFLKKDKYCSYR